MTDTNTDNPEPGGPLDPNNPPPPPPKKKGQRHEESNPQDGSADESEDTATGTQTAEANE